VDATRAFSLTRDARLDAWRAERKTPTTRECKRREDEGAVGAGGTARDCPYNEEGGVGHKGWPGVQNWRRASPSPNWQRASCRQATAARVRVYTGPMPRCRRGMSRVHRVWARAGSLRGTEPSQPAQMAAGRP
jgi:hypothetical protein